MKKLLMAGKKSLVFEIPDYDFVRVKSALWAFIILWRKPSQERQIKFLESLGLKKRPAKLSNGSTIKFVFLDEFDTPKKKG